MVLPAMTNHATVRWYQRFPHLNFVNEWSSARQLKGKAKRDLKMRSKSKEFRRYLISDSSVIFVCDKKKTVITVFSPSIFIKKRMGR